GHLLERELVDIDDDRHAGDALVLGRTDSEGVDVERAAREQCSDARERAGLVLEQHGEGVTGHGAGSSQSSRSHAGEIPCAYWMSSLLTPAATMGHTMASRETLKSMSTGWSLISRAFLIVASTSLACSTRRPTQPYASASLTKSG